ncbi:iron complex transport system ATP-binding protein [Verrucomicrobium sp. GAS474]|uniref:ABC transporter ATP-binding protein n=1 Tax=Verrucomicrobium sp. GAS474 TaxID=1882831 RepID=UPI00087A135A|nr:ABC transporter ATP-binding protein [Verrucomicrobium sp. GAS474]SDU27078.1 iron complex transport system ATP-binding protein [Verrucomicrobium sp. GAS474]
MRRPSSSSDQPILDIHGLSLLRETAILRDIDWTIGRGEHWVLLGANGSGKTSLLSALTGYLPASSGTVALLGRTFGAYDWRELRKQVGLVSSALRQRVEDGETGLEVVVTGKEAVVNHWGPVKAADRKKGLALLSRLGCRRLADRPWLFLSQGERQRVLIARALMADVHVLILDEPCAGLDPAAREEFLGFLQKWVARPDAPTVILVTHHVEEIVPGFTHGLVLRKGRVIASGTLEKTVTRAVLSAAFGARMGVSRRNGRYALKIG